VCIADNLTTFMCQLSRNLGVSTSWNPVGLSRPVMGLLFLLPLSTTVQSARWWQAEDYERKSDLAEREVIRNSNMLGHDAVFNTSRTLNMEAESSLETFTHRNVIPKRLDYSTWLWLPQISRGKYFFPRTLSKAESSYSQAFLSVSRAAIDCYGLLNCKYYK
jgi:hypothetical protein